MRLHVLHHARCFDGVASAAVFTAFYRAHIDRTCEPLFLPKRHRRGDPFDDADFGGDVNACVDFRYSQHPGLHWFFDHHVSAFQMRGDRAHFDADASGLKFHDPAAPCCAGLIAERTAEGWGFDPTPHLELLEWAKTIDTADFAAPDVPVRLTEPALQLALFIQTLEDPDTIGRLVEDLLSAPLLDVVNRPYVQSRVGPQLERHRADVELVQRRARRSVGPMGSVVRYDLVDDGARLLSHFIPYFHHPDVDYAVGLYRHVDGDLRLTVGFNPWQPPERRRHDLAAVCGRHGGGGHPHVAGASFEPGESDRARAALLQTVAQLCGDRSALAHAG